MSCLYNWGGGALKVAFRVDISDNIGTGHYMRMSVLAEAFKDLGCCCTIFTGQDEPIDYTDFKICILDTYEVNDEYIAALHSPNRVFVCYDDNALYTYNCDILLNANFHAKDLSFKFSGDSPQMLLGSQYALLRREFQESNPVIIKKNAQRVLLCFGGADVRSFTPFVIKALQNVPELHLTVILGAYTRCDNEVFALENERVKVLKNPQNIAEIMQSCDIAITAAGSMVYELAAMGLPSLVITQAENQLLIADYLQKNSLMRWLGDWNNVSCERLQIESTNLLQDMDRRLDESCKLKKMVNKNGAKKAAQTILELANEIC